MTEAITSPTANIISTPNNINVVIDDDVFIERMQKYLAYEDALKGIIENKDTYTDPILFKNQIEILQMYDIYEKNKKNEFSERIYLSILYHVSRISPENFHVWDFDQETDKGHVNYDQLVEFIEWKYTPIFFNENFYLYVNGQYYEDKNIKIQKDVYRKLKDENITKYMKLEPIIREVVKRCKAGYMKVGVFPFNKLASKCIPVKNHIIVINGEIHALPKSPVWGFTYALPINYDKNADVTKILKFLDDVTYKGDEKYIESKQDAELLIQIPAQALMQQTALPAYLLIGDGQNGKSTYINIISRLVGEFNVSNISLQDLTNDKYKVAELQGKLLNMHADLPSTALMSTGKFKNLTGEDAITIEKKYAHPWSFRNKAIMVFSANELPPVIADNTLAFWRRLNLISFTRQFPKNDGFLNEITSDKNLSAFFNLILARIKIIKECGLTISKETSEIMDIWKQNSNSAYKFIKEKLEISPNDKIPKKDLLLTYSRFCNENKLTEKSSFEFMKELEREGCTERKTTVNQETVRFVMGIKWKEIVWVNQ